MLYGLFVVIHVLVCIVLSGVVLLQSSKGGGLAGAFGGAGGSPQQMLGSRGMTTLLHKLTIYFAVAFFVTSFGLFLLQDTGTSTSNAGSSGSVVQEKAQSGELDVPVTTPAPQEAPVGSDQGGTDGGAEGDGN